MDGSVTQTVSVSTDVTLNVACGRITTFNSVTAAGAGFQFKLNNSAIDADSVIIANILGYSGAFLTNGVAELLINGVTAGSCFMGIYNLGSNAFNGSFIIGFQCL